MARIFARQAAAGKTSALGRRYPSAPVAALLVGALAACTPSAANPISHQPPPIVSHANVPTIPVTGIDNYDFLYAKMPVAPEQSSPASPAPTLAQTAWAAPVEPAAEPVASPEISNAEFLATSPSLVFTPPGCAATPPMSDSGNWFEMAVALIKAEEGFVANWEDIGDGNWTIGYGHAVPKTEAQDIAGPITEAQAEALLRNDLLQMSYIPAVANWFNVAEMTPTMLAVFTSFAYNTGPRGFEKYGVPHTGYAEIAQAIEHASDSKTQFPGLLCRRAREATIIRASVALNS